MGMTDGLKVTLKSIGLQNRTSRHIVIDGSDSDDVVNYCRKNFPEVEVHIRNPRGIYEAMNFGLSLISEDSWVLFLNEGDFLLGEDALWCLTEGSEVSKTWSYGSTIAFELNSSKREIYGRESTDWSVLKRGKLLIPHPSTAVRLNCINRVQGFRRIFAIAADIDLMYRIFLKFGPPTDRKSVV